MPRMPRRRSVWQQGAAAVVGTLEHRTLLTTINGGGIDPFTGLALANIVRYKDAHNRIVQIAVGGDTTAEFIAGRVTMTNNLVLGNLPPANVMDGQGQDLFHIYVSRSDSRSFITVTEVNQNGDLIPFAGSAGTFRVRNAVNGRTATVSPDG